MPIENIVGKLETCNLSFASFFVLIRLLIFLWINLKIACGEKVWRIINVYNCNSYACFFYVSVVIIVLSAVDGHGIQNLSTLYKRYKILTCKSWWYFLIWIVIYIAYLSIFAVSGHKFWFHRTLMQEQLEVAGTLLISLNCWNSNEIRTCCNKCLLSPRPKGWGDMVMVSVRLCVRVCVHASVHIFCPGHNS